MADIRIEEVKRSHSSLIFMVLVLFLYSIGFVTLMSVLSTVAETKMLKQIIFSGVGLVVFLVMSSGLVTKEFVDRVLNSKFPFIFFCSVLFLCFITPMVGPEINGANRWLVIGGISIQPSEFLKVAVILFFSTYLANEKKRPKTDSQQIKRTSFCVFLLILVFAIMMFQRDFSTAFVICGIMVFLMMLGKIPLLHILIMFILGISLCLLAILQKPYRLSRILHPDYYQADISVDAISNGGWLGCGWGEGLVKSRGILPEAETDFIFAVLAEELGFLGVLAFFILMLIIIGKGFSIASRSKDDPQRVMLVLGVLFSYAFQTMINLGVVVRLFPTTGLPLPFFSQGGSSLITTLFLFGLIVHVARTLEENDG